MMDTTRTWTMPVVESHALYHAVADPAVETDYQRMAQVLQQSELPFETLYDRYAGRGIGLAFQILQDRDLAEEVTLEAFWWVWQYAFSFQTAHVDFSEWFSEIVRHLATKELRSRVMQPLPIPAM